jgi:hypothetical protein
MPYAKSNRLSGEKANKMGHIEVVNSKLVNRLLQALEEPLMNDENLPSVDWIEIEPTDDVLQTVFAVDGSLQTIFSKTLPRREVSFIKTALFTLDQKALEKIDPDYPHPMRLKKIMEESALYHSTLFPLKNAYLPELNSYDTVRHIIYESFLDESLNAEPLETLKWLAYEKWTDDKTTRSLSFECPHCHEKIDGLSYDTSIGNCQHCSNGVFITDMLGFHLDMQDDSVPATVATSYMLIHETMLLFTAIRFFWDAKKYATLKTTLFLKDGPLALHSQYSKLVPRIRSFIIHARDKDVPIYLAGQEKTGRFVDYLQMLSLKSPGRLAYFIPNNDFIDHEIRERPNRQDPCGSRVNYGNKLFVCNDKYHHVVLSIPTGEYKDTNNIDDLIGAKKIINTVHKLVSHKHENALLPIQLANGIASLSTYPSAQVLKLFASKIVD